MWDAGAAFVGTGGTAGVVFEGGDDDEEEKERPTKSKFGRKDGNISDGNDSGDGDAPMSEDEVEPESGSAVGQRLRSHVAALSKEAKKAADETLI